MIFTFEKRYSQLRSVHKSLRRTFNDPPNLPKFPPKKIIGNLEREFVNERYQQLHDYFSTIPLLFKIEQNQEFKQCFNYQMLYAMWRSGVEASIHNTSLPFQGLWFSIQHIFTYTIILIYPLICICSHLFLYFCLFYFSIQLFDCF